MTESITLEQIHNEVASLRDEIATVKLWIMDPDTMMTAEDERRIAKARKDLREGKTIGFEGLKKKVALKRK